MGDFYFFDFLEGWFFCWWVTAHWVSSKMTFSRDLPWAVMEYSTPGGKESMTFRSMSWIFSNSFSSFDNILSVIPGISSPISLNRLFPNDKDIMMGSFHFPLKISKASRKGKMRLAHSVWSGWQSVVFPFSTLLLTSPSLAVSSTERNFLDLRILFLQFEYLSI